MVILGWCYCFMSMVNSYGHVGMVLLLYVHGKQLWSCWDGVIALYGDVGMVLLHYVHGKQLWSCWDGVFALCPW